MNSSGSDNDGFIPTDVKMTDNRSKWLMMKSHIIRSAAFLLLLCLFIPAVNGAFGPKEAYAETSYIGTMYDEMVYWGDAAAYLYYYADTSGYSPESVLYYYCEKDGQEEVVRTQFEKMALYALISNFPDKDMLRSDDAQGYVYVKKDAMDIAASELYGIDMDKAAGYCSFFASAGDEYVFLKQDTGNIIPQSAAHDFSGDMMSGYMCLTEAGTWVEPYEYDMYLEPVQNGRYSNYRFSYMVLKVPESYKKISTGKAEEEMISVRLMSLLYHEPGNAFLSRDFTGTEDKDGTVTYECDGTEMTFEELAEYLCPEGDDTERVRVELGYIFKNKDHYIADYGEGLLEVRMTKERELIFIRNKRYKK